MNSLATTSLAPATTASSAAGFTLAEGYYLVQTLDREMHGMGKRGKVGGRMACSGGRFTNARAVVQPQRVPCTTSPCPGGTRPFTSTRRKER